MSFNLSVNYEFADVFQRLVTSRAWILFKDRAKMTTGVKSIAQIILGDQQSLQVRTVDQLFTSLRSWVERNISEMDQKQMAAIASLWQQSYPSTLPKDQELFLASLRRNNSLNLAEIVLRSVDPNRSFAENYQNFSQAAWNAAISIESVEVIFLHKLVTGRNSQLGVEALCGEIFLGLEAHHQRFKAIFCSEFRNFKFTDPVLRMRLTNMISVTTPGLFLEHFDKFGFDDYHDNFRMGMNFWKMGPLYLIRFLETSKTLTSEDRWHLAANLAFLDSHTAQTQKERLKLDTINASDYDKLLGAICCYSLIFNPDNWDVRDFQSHMIGWINEDSKYKFPIPSALKQFWFEASLSLLQPELDVKISSTIIDWIVAHDLIEEDKPLDLQSFDPLQAWRLLNGIYHKHPEWVEKYYMVPALREF